MLVLSRMRDEVLMIGDNIEVTVVDIRGDKVRLGITAPRNVPVHRREVWLQIKAENMAATVVNPDPPPEPTDLRPKPSGSEALRALKEMGRRGPREVKR